MTFIVSNLSKVIQKMVEEMRHRYLRTTKDIEGKTILRTLEESCGVFIIFTDGTYTYMQSCDSYIDNFTFESLDYDLAVQNKVISQELCDEYTNLSNTAKANAKLDEEQRAIEFFANAMKISPESVKEALKNGAIRYLLKVSKKH